MEFVLGYRVLSAVNVGPLTPDVGGAPIVIRVAVSVLVVILLVATVLIVAASI
jgi:hypothetical protein